MLGIIVVKDKKVSILGKDSLARSTTENSGYTMNYLLISTLRKLLQKNVGDGEYGIEIFIFGSLLVSTAPRDVDILILYDETSWSALDAIDLRRRLRESIQTITILPADITLLSVNENAESCFLQDINAIRLF